MKMINISNTNQKGQLVIPAMMRAHLGITEDVPLQITLKGNAIYIIPIIDVITVADAESSYGDVLKRTQGSWGDTLAKNEQKRKLELSASEQRKTAW